MLCARNPFPGMFCGCFKFLRSFSIYWLCFGFIEAASRAIVQFLEINQSEEASRGWMLLTTINLLASSGQVSAGVVCGRALLWFPIQFFVVPGSCTSHDSLSAAAS